MYKKIALMLAALMLVMIGFIAGTSVVSTFASNTPASEVEFVPEVNFQTNPPDLSGLTPAEQALANVYNRVSPSVVAISVSTGRGGGSGSGFVIDQNGHIVTNFHVVDSAQEIVVNFYDGTITRAEIVGLDPDSDLAVIKVDLPVERLHPVQMGSSDQLVVGQTVLAIGSPFGERWTLTSGIVSALDRTIQGLNQYSTERGISSSYSIGSVIQTDAAINPGNSGGPLINLQGQVVGVNSQIRTETGANTGIGFAIPSVLVEKVAQELIENGKIDYSLIGLQGGDVGLGAIEGLNLANNQRGVVVSQAITGGPAANAGLRSARITENGRLVSADIITAINGLPLEGMNDLIAFLARETRPGDVVTLTVLRDGQFIEIPVTLASRNTR